MTSSTETCKRQVKSRLLPLSPLESALEWLIERLPRRLVLLELEPNDSIAAIDQKKGEYNATGNAPSFEIKLDPALTQGGWYYLEAALVRNNGSREASIRADICSERKESIIIPIPTNLRGTVREVFYLPPNVSALHWSPTAAQGFFSQSNLLAHKITLLESVLRRMSRVIFDLWRFRDRTPATRAGLSLWGAIGNLQDAYRRTAILRINRLLGSDYSVFIALNETLKKADIRAMRKQVPQLPMHPLISLVMPVHDPRAEFFRGALDSVSAQIYPYWELLLAGDFSAANEIHAIANEYRHRNAQVKIVSVKPGGDLATILNRALELAQGEFVARINQHDQMPPQTLFCLAREISRHPDADLIYTDDDSIDDTNRRLDPRFKPDWNPDMFFSYNYLANLTLYRHARALELGGYRPGFDGAEDYDLSLRYLRDTPEHKIRHIPRVLYHTRTASQAPAPTSSPQLGDGWRDGAVHQSGKGALASYFEGSGVVVEDGPAPGLYRIKRPLPTPPPLVSIIIPTRDRVEILRKCIESIQQNTDYENWEMLVIDNQSVEPETHTYLEQIKHDSRINVICYEKPFNYSAMNNYAVQFTRGEILALLNNDVEVISREWLTEMVSHAIRPGVGAVGAKLLYSNGMVQHAGVILGLGGVAGHAHKHLNGDDHGYCHRAIIAQDFSAVTGACMVVRKSCYLEVGGMNKENLAVAFNDIDFCLKLAASGYRNIFTPYALLYHHESLSRGQNDTLEKQNIFQQEYKYMKKIWRGKLESDPAYNPNLTLEFENFCMTLSPRDC